MLVSDIMTLDPDCCTPECSAQEAARRMRQWSTGVLPVVEDAETRKIAGIVTDRDLCMGIVAAGKDPAQATVREVMTAETVCCAAGEPVARALEAMRDHHVRRLPVVDSAGRVVGIVSLTDIIRYAALTEAEIVAAVAHICEPLGALGRRKHSEAVSVNR